MEENRCFSRQDIFPPNPSRGDVFMLPGKFYMISILSCKDQLFSFNQWNACIFTNDDFSLVGTCLPKPQEDLLTATQLAYCENSLRRIFAISIHLDYGLKHWHRQQLWHCVPSNLTPPISILTVSALSVCIFISRMLYILLQITE